ncbi:hypothetical protein, conserved in T. vivax [Trypanosoma vivax Y486]|uniref:Uncharacterized protein n=1 Tax=Trypanosoma vivax (strain Y486) TaxID=1055687 RepID=F9WNL7_TRYVY|nr:hypothetical protein, conserved in T. vivax [Trypanosoma vivax Y486]|eukprot:CCD19135.1 hypothetical protein, conserved in T. vivax [Trypanosoma vivax Y486]
MASAVVVTQEIFKKRVQTTRIESKSL